MIKLLRVTGYGLRVTSYELRVMGYVTADCLVSFNYKNSKKNS